MHSLAYGIKHYQRASKFEQLIHPILKRGHSNNVFIRFRQKYIHLERLHYTLSTELLLLQSNMTCTESMDRSIIGLLNCSDGAYRALEEFNELRMEKLEHEKTEKSKKRRIILKVETRKDAQCCKEWSKKHGYDTYGDDEDGDTAELKPKEKKSRKGQKLEGQCTVLQGKRANFFDLHFLWSNQLQYTQ